MVDGDRFHHLSDVLWRVCHFTGMVREIAPCERSSEPHQQICFACVLSGQQTDWHLELCERKPFDGTI